MKSLSPEELAVIAAKPVLTPTEVAILSGISVAHLYALWKAGGGPVNFHVGRCRRIRRVALDAWIKQREKTSE